MQAKPVPKYDWRCESCFSSYQVGDQIQIKGTCKYENNNVKNEGNYDGSVFPNEPAAASGRDTVVLIHKNQEVTSYMDAFVLISAA